MATDRSTWKAFERRVAKFFGTVRTSLSGGNGKLTRSDSHHEDFFIDCKLREKMQHHTTLAEFAPRAEKEGKIPVLVTQKKNSKTPVVSIYMDDVPAFCRKYLESRGYIVARKSSSPRKEAEQGVLGMNTFHRGRNR